MHAANYLNQATGFYSDETGREKALKALVDSGSWNGIKTQLLLVG